MTCADIEILICDYVDGILDGAQQAVVEKHLAECPACAELARDAAAAVSFVENVPPVEPPEHLVTKILYQTPASELRREAGWRSWLGRWLEPVLQPRFAMGMAMTILSFSLLARFVGVDRQLRPQDLHPANVLIAVEDRFQRTWDRAVKYYENLRVVYDIQNRLSEWSPEEEQTGADTGYPEFDPSITEAIPARPEGNDGASERNSQP